MLIDTSPTRPLAHARVHPPLAGRDETADVEGLFHVLTRYWKSRVMKSSGKVAVPSTSAPASGR